MAFQPAPDCAEVVFLQVSQGIQIRNVMTFRKTTGYSQSDLNALAIATSQAWSDSVLENQYLTLSFNGVEVRGLTLQNDLYASSALGAGIGGFTSGTPFPNNVAYCVKFVSTFTGRSARGRIYIGGLGTAHADTNENFVSSSIRTALRDAVEVVGSSAPAGWEHVIVSRWSNNEKRTTAVAFPVDSYQTTDARFDTQRRRME